MAVYIPIIRDGRNEREVVEHLDEYGSSARSGESKFTPLIEIVSEDDTAHLDTYRDIAGKIMVELPLYLIDSNNKHSSDVLDILTGHGSLTEFYQTNLNAEDIPVISGSAQTPIDYSKHLERYQSVAENSDPVALRLFVTGAQLDDEQKASIDTLFKAIRPSDIVLLDLIDVVGGFDGGAYDNLVYLADTAGDNQVHVLNAFKYDDSSHNYGPIVAQELGAAGFGDFGINKRYPQEIGGRPPTQYIRLYDEDRHEIRNFGGKGYEEAFDRLNNSGEWNSDHCEFCEQIEVDRNWGPSFWKRVRMGHYMSSVMGDTLDRIEQETGTELDERGYNAIRERNNGSNQA